MKELILKIIESIEKNPSKWEIGQNCISYYNKGNYITVCSGFLFKRPYIYINGTKLRFVRPFLRLRLKRTIRKFLINEAIKVFKSGNKK